MSHQYDNFLRTVNGSCHSATMDRPDQRRCVVVYVIGIARIIRMDLYPPLLVVLSRIHCYIKDIRYHEVRPVCHKHSSYRGRNVVGLYTAPATRRSIQLSHHLQECSSCQGAEIDRPGTAVATEYRCVHI
jgi:hypothetical protein